MTLLVVLACLAAAALETCDEVHQHARHADSATGLTSGYPIRETRATAAFSAQGR